MTRRLTLSLIPFAVALVGCPGDLENPDRFAEQFAQCPDVPKLFVQTCTASNCHDKQAPMGALDLASPNLAGRLVGKTAAGGPGLLIDPNTPEDSVIYTKLTAAPPFLSRMPLTGGPLDETQIACVLDWVQASTEGSSP